MPDIKVVNTGESKLFVTIYVDPATSPTVSTIEPGDEENYTVDDDNGVRFSTVDPTAFPAKAAGSFEEPQESSGATEEKPSGSEDNEQVSALG
jgi:hypothetical protein